MREAHFIKQNKEKWLEFEKFLYHEYHISADQLSDLFVQLNNDLAFSQTYYPKSKLNDYLNALASNAYMKITKPKTSYGSVVKFWKEDVPLIVYQRRNYIYFAFCIYIILMLIGVLSSLYDDSFIRSILGDHYVDQSQANINRGDPAAIYNNSTLLGDAGSAIAITINNVRVGFLMYISGITLGLGTFKILFSNSIMVGAFMSMFYKAGIFGKAMSAVYIHGAMELFGMVIEAAAGFLLGLGWLFPSNRTRLEAFIISGKHSVMIVLSTIPFTIAAGLLEGFVTQYYNEMPLVLTLIIILGTLSLISYYYLIYPYIVHKKKYHKTLEDYLDDHEA